MENKIIHFIFNWDNCEDEKKGLDIFSKRILENALPCWLVKDFPGFLICLETLPKEQIVTVWVHLRGLVEDSKATYKGEDIAGELKRRLGNDFHFEYITRTDIKGVNIRDGIPIININDLHDKVKETKYYHRVGDILNNNRDKDLVFISHSSEDKEICDKLERLLVNGYAIPRDKIFYTSGKGTGIPTTKDIPSELQKNISNVGLFISVFTNNYLKSDISKSELGALKLGTYLFDNNSIIILKDDKVEYKDTGMLHSHDIILDLSNKSHYYKIFDDFKEFFNKYPIKIEKLHEELEGYFK